MKLLVVGFLVFGALSAEYAHAQSQTTLGACSPAINGVAGSVSVTCLTSSQRIRVARFTGTIDDDQGKSLGSFVAANLGKVIFVHTRTDMRNGYYKFFQKPEDGFVEIDDYCLDGHPCGKVDVFFNAFRKPSTAYIQHGNWAFNGYYLVQGGASAMGATEYALKPIDEETIVMSPKYDTD